MNILIPESNYFIRQSFCLNRSLLPFSFIIVFQPVIIVCHYASEKVFPFVIEDTVFLPCLYCYGYNSIISSVFCLVEQEIKYFAFHEIIIFCKAFHVPNTLNDHLSIQIIYCFTWFFILYKR